jgi:GH24 family phage-related lysozyme (muramidase)
MGLSTIKFEQLSRMKPSHIKEIQRLLNNCGYGLVEDGIVGALTTNAYNEFKKAHFLDHPDIFGQTTYNYLLRYDKGLDPAIALIKEFEGYRSKAYLCPAKTWTIGWGTTVYPDGEKVKEGDNITIQKADEYLIWYIKDRIVPKLSSSIPYWHQMSNGQRCALISFAYNVGENFYGARGFTTITRVLSSRDWESVPSSLRLYVNPGTHFAEGLRRRREKEIKLWGIGE